MNLGLPKSTRSFLLRLVLVYGLLILPWPGVSDCYGAFFRGLGRLVFSSEDGRRELDFEKGISRPAMSMTRIVIVNRALMARDGSGPVRNLDMDTGGFWGMTALLVGLVAATPVSWRRRLRALIWGEVAIHGFLLCTVAFSLWNEGRYVTLVSLSPFWQSTADKLQDTLLSQLSLAVPVLVWLLVTFRREDYKLLAAASQIASRRDLPS